ncbi:MAG: hypothetical protein ALAOOOJD_00666 [bacterium]|nr:hypothetical protein [bacterium]
MAVTFMTWKEMSAMKNHLRILGVFYLVFGLLGAVIGFLLFEVKTGRMFFPGKMSMIANPNGYVSVIALIFAFEAIPALVTGVALLRRWLWARMSALALSFVNLFIIPLGTALGIYGLWVLINDTTLSESNSEFVDEKQMPRVFPPYH